MSKEMNYEDFVVDSKRGVDPIVYEDSEFFRVWNNLQFMPCIRCQRWALDNITGDEGTTDGGPHTYEGWDLCVPCEHNLRVVSELRRGGPSKEFKNRANYRPQTLATEG